METTYGVAAIVTAFIGITALLLGALRASALAGYYQDRGEPAPIRNVVRGGIGIATAGASLVVLALIGLAGGVIAGAMAAVIVTSAAVLALGAVIAAIAFSRTLFSYPPITQAAVVYDDPVGRAAIERYNRGSSSLSLDSQMACYVIEGRAAEHGIG